MPGQGIAKEVADGGGVGDTFSTACELPASVIVERDFKVETPLTEVKSSWKSALFIEIRMGGKAGAMNVWVG